MTEGSNTCAATRLWDLPVRIVHWSLVLLLPALWWTSETHDLTTHTRLGFMMIGLVAFRLLWGLVGSSTARFAGFLKGPAAIRAYLRGSAAPVVGHNPLGGWSVIALLLLLATQVGLGTIAQDVDGLESGPLSYLVAYDTADAAREWHGRIFNIILGFTALHVVAIGIHLFVKHDNLLLPMLTGRRRYDREVAVPRIAPVWVGALCAATAAALAYWISRGAHLPAF